MFKQGDKKVSVTQTMAVEQAGSITDAMRDLIKRLPEKISAPCKKPLRNLQRSADKLLRRILSAGEAPPISSQIFVVELEKAKTAVEGIKTSPHLKDSQAIKEGLLEGIELLRRIPQARKEDAGEILSYRRKFAAASARYVITHSKELGRDGR
jgi:hypothetical protein